MQKRLQNGGKRLCHLLQCHSLPDFIFHLAASWNSFNISHEMLPHFPASCVFPIVADHEAEMLESNAYFFLCIYDDALSGVDPPVFNGCIPAKAVSAASDASVTFSMSVASSMAFWPSARACSINFQFSSL